MLAMWNSSSLAHKRLSVTQHGDSFQEDAYDVSLVALSGVCLYVTAKEVQKG